MMRAALNKVEHYLLSVALTMFLLLCALSFVGNGIGTVVITRNLLFLITGMSGMLIAAQLDDFRKMRLSQKRKRMLRIAQTLLCAFSLVVTIFALFEFGMIAGLNRWD